MNNPIKIDLWLGYSGSAEKRDQLLKYWGSEITKQGMPENSFLFYQGQKRLGDKYINVVPLSDNWMDNLLSGIKASPETVELIKGIHLTGVQIDSAIFSADGLIKNPRSFVDNGYSFYYVGLYSVYEI